MNGPRHFKAWGAAQKFVLLYLKRDNWMNRLCLSFKNRIVWAIIRRAVKLSERSLLHPDHLIPSSSNCRYVHSTFVATHAYLEELREQNNFF